MQAEITFWRKARLEEADVTGQTGAVVLAQSYARPSLTVVPKKLDRENIEQARSRPPGPAFDREIWPVDLNHVQRIRLAAAARRCACPRRNDNGRVARHLVALGGLAGVGNVKMTGQEKIDAAFGQRLHGQARTPDHAAGRAGGQIEGMMRDHDLGAGRWSLVVSGPVVLAGTSAIRPTGCGHKAHGLKSAPRASACSGMPRYWQMARLPVVS